MKTLDEAHWWGYAALPEQAEYPLTTDKDPMTLICQFHLGEGMVYVFANLDYFFGDIDADGGHIGEWSEDLYKVLYSPTREHLQEHEVVDANDEPAVPAPIALEENKESTVLTPATCWRDELEQDYPGYQVLVDLEESDDLGLRFYDCGSLFFLIRPEDLAARRFEHVKCALYSY